MARTPTGAPEWDGALSLAACETAPAAEPTAGCDSVVSMGAIDAGALVALAVGAIVILAQLSSSASWLADCLSNTAFNEFAFRCCGMMISGLDSGSEASR